MGIYVFFTAQFFDAHQMYRMHSTHSSARLHPCILRSVNCFTSSFHLLVTWHQQECGKSLLV